MENTTKDFRDYPQKELNGGVQHIAKFDNGYGASIIRHQFSYGGNSGLWELAVIKYDENGDWALCYDTTITDDVLGHLTIEEVNETLEKIAAL